MSRCTLKRVICIVVTDSSLIPDDNNYHHRFTLYDLKTGSILTDLLEVNTLELSKLPTADDGSDLWSWMKFLTVETKEELSMIAEKSPTLKKAAMRLIDVSMNRNIRDQYEWRRLAEMDERVMMRAAAEKGRMEGRTEECEKWQTVVAEKDRAIVEKDQAYENALAELEKYRTQFGSIT